VSALLASACDHEVVLFAGDARHPFYGTLPAPEASVVEVRQGGGLARVGWALGAAARRSRVDVLHVQYMAPLHYRGPLVVTVHDLSFLAMADTFRMRDRLALRTLVPRSIARARRVITDSEYSRRDIVATYGLQPDTVRVIGLAAAPRFRPLPDTEVHATLRRHGVEPGFVFSLSRLNRRKNLQCLLLAHAALRAHRVVPPLIIGGKPDPADQDVRRRLRSGPDNGVRWLGLLPDEDLPAFYAGSACFVYPSLFEGFGLPVLEAMACGTPVIAADRTALPELVAEAGLLVDPESVDALSAALARVLDDRAFARSLGHRGVERSRGYSWPETARRTLAVYRAAAGDPGSSP
jgi:glycosyltransferase involved in cell wall biosynthesis